MSRLARFTPWVLALLLLAPVGAGEAAAEEGIAWVEDLPSAFATAKAQQKILMICVNAKHVTGRQGEEPAAKGLREVVYKDARVIERSRDLVCALLTAEGSADDYGELRVLGIDGDLVSPQHIFVHPDGARVLYRKEYWSYGQGEPAVEALLGMMDKARAKLQAEAAEPESSDAPDAAPDGADRAVWIAERIGQVVSEGGAKREAALDALIQHDRDGDCIASLIPLLVEHKKNHILLEAVIRALGRDGLQSAALPVSEFLRHKNDALRANAAVSLEYIGSREKKVVGALKKAVGKEKDAGIANHMYRALGRCGVEDPKVRALLLKKADAGKSEFATYGPCIGLTYFEGDEKARRGVEKLLKKLGVPGSKRGGGQNTVKRGLLSWTLAAIGDAKSAEFVREELIARLENVQAFWVEGLRGFWASVAEKCDGDDSLMPGIEAGVRAFVGFAKEFDLGRYGAETRSLMDASRKERDTSTFRPRGDNLLDTGDED